MSDVDHVLRILRDAAIALRATKGRKGTLVQLEDAEDVIVAGDLHGNLVNFRNILRIADLDRHPGRHLVLQEFVHGSGRYPNGGCMSHRLLDIVSALKCQYGHRVHLLIGNHELSEWTGRPISKEGITFNRLFAAGVEAAYGKKAPDVIQRYHELFAAMPLAVRTQNRVFMSHTIPPAKFDDQFDVGIFSKPAMDEEQRGRNTSFYHLLWGRDVSEEAAMLFSKKVDADLFVTGHIAYDQGYGIPNSRQLIVDCMRLPAACVRFPANRPITHEELVDGLIMLPMS